MYDAEDRLPHRWSNQFGTNAATQEWANNLLRSRWFRQRWAVREITVTPGRNLNGHSYGGVITVSPAGRNPVVVLHEITHEVLRYANLGPRASHGPEFCATYLFLVRHVMGADNARLLERGFVEHRVRYRAAADVVPRTPRNAVPTARQVREREREQATTPPSRREIAAAAVVVRALVSQGTYGPAGSKPRTKALETARTLEAASLPSTPAASLGR